MTRFSLDEFCRRHFPALTLLLLLSAVLHTLWATSLDSFTIDEPYHITAGATYLRWHDYRINPEHPPLVKLVVALAEPASVLHLQPFTHMRDKPQERVYTQTAVYKLSDYHQVQRRARFAMITFDTVLLGGLAVLLRRVFSPGIAVVALLLLALDPTISAHMPVMMTDLGTALLGTICCCLGVLAVRCRRWRDWVLLGVGVGLLLGTKHSAPLIVLPVYAGCVAALGWQAWRRQHSDLALQLGRLAASAVLAFVVLWSLYGFRYHESHERDSRGNYVETYNRTLAEKIDDLHTPILRSTLTAANRVHLLPRAYLWGLADTLRAGVEGRPSLVRAWGKDYFDTAPWWIPFADLLVKLPVPFTLLAVTGLVLLLARRLTVPNTGALAASAAMLVFFLAFIAKNGVFYAGLRHWLFAVPLMAVLAAAAAVDLVEQRSAIARLLPAVAVLLIALPTLGQRRIWEYHNLLVGGSGSAWKYFDNESVDVGQRSNELIAYYNANMRPAAPLYGYWTMLEQREAEHIPLFEPKPEDVKDGYLDGWFITNLPQMPEENWKHVEIFKTLTPTARFGNAAVYHGRFYLPNLCGNILIGQSMRELYSKENGDREKAERYLRRGVQMNPENPSAFVELANFALERKDKAEALQMLQSALKAEVNSETMRAFYRKCIANVQGGDLRRIRRPNME